VAESGRSLKPFYLILGLIAVVGVVLIVRAGGGNPAAKLTVSGCDTVPAGRPAPVGVVLGPDSAKIEITEFSDFECPYCARFAILTMPDVRQRLIPTGLVKWRYMNFPLEGHANSPAAHLAAACALDQGKFWEMHDALYAGQNDWVPEKNPQHRILEYARRIGLNDDAFQACMRDHHPWPQIEAQRCDGVRRGVGATPTFFLNGRQLRDVPAYDDFKRMVDSLAAATAPAPKPAAAKGR
jgi:protein-disulfide isomerase